MEFAKKAMLQVRNRFSPKSDIGEVVAFVREQKVPGELRIVFPGNTGITAIEFFEKAKEHAAEELS